MCTYVHTHIPKQERLSRKEELSELLKQQLAACRILSAEDFSGLPGLEGALAGRACVAHSSLPLRTAENPQPEIHPGLKEGSVLGEFFARKWDGAVVVSHGEDRMQQHLCFRQPAVLSSACSLLRLPQFYLAWAPRSRRHRAFPYPRLSLCGCGEPGRAGGKARRGRRRAGGSWRGEEGAAASLRGGSAADPERGRGESSQPGENARPR